MSARDDGKVAFPDRWFINRAIITKHRNGKWVDADDAESYAAARVAEATDELQRRVAELEDVVETVAAMNEEHPLFLGSDLSQEEINGIGGDAAHVTDTALILRKILSDRERGKT